MSARCAIIQTGRPDGRSHPRDVAPLLPSSISAHPTTVRIEPRTGGPGQTAVPPPMKPPVSHATPPGSCRLTWLPSHLHSPHLPYQHYDSIVAKSAPIRDPSRSRAAATATRPRTLAASTASRPTAAATVDAAFIVAAAWSTRKRRGTITCPPPPPPPPPPLPLTGMAVMRATAAHTRRTSSRPTRRRASRRPGHTYLIATAGAVAAAATGPK